MPKYKLTYFNLRGYAEMARYMFVEAGVEYEDFRFTQEDWIKIKPNMPYGAVPVLYVDDIPIANSRAIVRYLAKEFKLDGGTGLSAAQNDVIIETFFERIGKLPLQNIEDESQIKLIKEATVEHMFPMFKVWENQIKSSGGPYFFGKDPQAADFTVASMMPGFDSLQVNLDEFPALNNLTKSFNERPKIKEWISKRPCTDH